MNLNRSGIYEIVNTRNGKRYVGSAKCLRVRFGKHRRSLSVGKHHSGYLQRAWDKYGVAAFEFHVLMICAPDDLLDYEQRAINGLDPAYNICRTAGSQLGRVPSAEARARMSIAHLDRKFSPEHCAKIAASKLGKRRPMPSLTARENMAKAQFGRKHTVETIAKMTGKVRSPQTRERMAASARVGWIQRRNQANSTGEQV